MSDTLEATKPWVEVWSGKGQEWGGASGEVGLGLPDVGRGTMLELGQGRGCTSVNPPPTRTPSSSAHIVPEPCGRFSPQPSQLLGGCWGGRKRVVLAHAEAERGLGAPSLRGVEPTVRQRDPELAWSAGPARAPGLHCPPRFKPAFPGPRSPCTRGHRCLRAGGHTRAPAFHRRTLKHRARGFWSKLAAESPARLSPSTFDPLLLLLASCKAGGGAERWDLQP